MLYPVYMRPADDQCAHSVTLPDFSGCFSAADEWADLPARIQEAVELHMEGEGLDIPEPSSLDIMLALEQSGEYEGGFWMMLDIDVEWNSLRESQSLAQQEWVHVDLSDMGNQVEFTDSIHITQDSREIIADRISKHVEDVYSGSCR